MVRRSKPRGIALAGVVAVVVMAAIGGLVGLNASGSNGPKSTADPIVRQEMPFRVLDRPRRSIDRMPGGPYESAVGGIIAQPETVRRVRIRAPGYRLWIGRGAAQDVADPALNLDPEVICLYVMNRRDALVGSGCAPRLRARDPGALLVVLSGGAAGAPGFRAREALVAGVVADDVTAAWLEGRGARQPVRVRDNGFIRITRRLVDGIGFSTAAGIARRQLHTCQSC